MLRLRFLLPLFLLTLLVGCQQEKPVLSDPMQNPLVSERYGQALAEQMAELVIQKDPILQDGKKADIIEKARVRGLERMEEAAKNRHRGISGSFVPVKVYAIGEALFLKDVLYFSPEFETDPGPSLRVFLTTLLDPREEKFPDETAVDLGPLYSPYGAQAYAVPAKDPPPTYRSVVLWDTRLERLYGFAQLQ